MIIGINKQEVMIIIYQFQRLVINNHISINNFIFLTKKFLSYLMLSIE